MILIIFLFSFISTAILTPFVIRLAKRLGVTDQPNFRKVHQQVMPRMGGLAIFAGCIIGYVISGLHEENITAITISSVIIVFVGLLDDKYQLRPYYKLFGQIVAAGIVVYSGLTIEFLEVPFLGRLELGNWSFIVTVGWILGITNAINLIDGLDGLAAGISAIVLSTIGFLAFMNEKNLILTMCIILLGSTLGFLIFNFYPAKIFMGDTGALFLGFSISIISLLGLYKSVTLFSFIVPMIILGVPIFDTIFAIFRRVKDKRPITEADKEHLHHKLLKRGISHRMTVIIMYIISMIFSIIAVIFSSTVLWGTILLILALFFLIELVAGAGRKQTKSLSFYRRIFGKN